MGGNAMDKAKDTIVVPLPMLLDVFNNARLTLACVAAVEDANNRDELGVDRACATAYVWEPFTDSVGELFGDLMDADKIYHLIDVIVGCIEVNPKIEDNELADVMSLVGIQTY